MTVNTDTLAADPSHAFAGGWILVVDDHPLFCDAMEMTLRYVVPDADVRTADTLAKAIDLIETHGAPSLVTLDLNLPDVTGLDGMIDLMRRANSASFIIVSSMADNKIIASALAAGAAGFVPKHSSRGVIEEALTEIGAGRTYVPQGFSPLENGEDETSRTLARLSSLTQQQARILQLICEGKLNKQIAYDLSIAETTVKAHVTAIMRKLGVQSRTQAVLVAQTTRFSTDLPDTEV